MAVTARLDVRSHSLYQCVKRYSAPPAELQKTDDQQTVVTRLNAELKRVTEERDILKRPSRTLPRCPDKVRLHSRCLQRAFDPKALQDDIGASERLLRLVHRARKSAGARTHCLEQKIALLLPIERH